MPVIDVHSHYLPPELIGPARAGDGFDGARVEVVDGQEWFVQRAGNRQPLVPGISDVEARLADMDTTGIDHAVVSISPMLYHYHVAADEAVDFCRLANDSLARTVADGDGRLSGTATLPMQDPAAAVAELERGVGELGLRGAQLGPLVEQGHLDDPELAPVLEAAARLGVPVILHPYPGAVSTRLEDFYLRNLIGNPLQSTIAAARLIFSGLLDRLPSLEVILLHGGGFLPYQIGRMDHGWRVRAESKGCARAPSSYLRRFTYDTITHRPEALDFLIRSVGADRVAYGTDFPYDMAGGPFAEQVGEVELDDGDREQISSGNARRLFGLA